MKIREGFLYCLSMEPQVDVVHCHFWDPNAGAGKNPNSKCEGTATSFVRKKHDGRLCPLCGTCKETFLRAQKEMPADVKDTIPGHGEVEEVELSPKVVEEFRSQPARKTGT